MRDVRGRRIGIIFQEPATSLNPVLTVGAQIIEVIERHTPLKGAAARARALEWLRRVGLPEPERRIDSYPFQMSGGQKQRVMIAIALAAEPDVADRRRADDRARRDRAEADPRPAAGPAEGPGHGDAADHARPRHRVAGRAPHRADVRRPDRRGRGDGGVLRAAAASVRADAARRAARLRQARPAARRDRRNRAAARPGLRSLPLLRPLPGSACGVRGTARRRCSSRSKATRSVACCTETACQRTGRRGPERRTPR